MNCICFSHKDLILDATCPVHYPKQEKSELEPMKTTTQEQIDRFKQFLADECYDLKKYKDGKYDKKIFNYFTTIIETTRKETAEDLVELRKQAGLVMDAANSQLEKQRSQTLYRMIDELSDKYLTESEEKDKQIRKARE